MSQRRNTVKVGVFTLAGIALFIGGIVLIGSGVFAEAPISVETYFDESVAGLQVGAPIKFRGVQIGNVAEINFCGTVYGGYREDLADEPAGDSEENRENDYVYVRIGLYPEVFENRDPSYIHARIAKMVRKGMRVRLQSQGITGIVHLEADFPETEASEPLTYPWQPRYPYVPSTKSTIARVSDSVVEVLADLSEVPFESIGRNLDELLLTAEQQLESFDLAALNREASETLESLRGFIDEAKGILEKAELEKSGPELRRAIEELRGLAERLEPRLDELATRGTGALQRYENVAAELQSLLARVDDLTERNAPAVTQILRWTEDVVRNLERVTSDAKRYPSYLLFGEPPATRERP